MILFLVERFLQGLIIKAKYFLEDKNGAFQWLQFLLQGPEGFLKVDLEVEMRKIRFTKTPENFGKLNLAELTEKVFLLAMQCLQVISAVVDHGLHKICLEIDDVTGFQGQELQKCLLDNVLCVFLAPNEVIGNGLKEGLIEGDRLSMHKIQSNGLIATLPL